MNHVLANLESAMAEPETLAVELAHLLSPQSVIRPHLPLSKRTTLRVGGPADLYIEPAFEEDLSRLLQFCAERKLLFFVLGRGSNLLVRDGGFRGVVISLAQPEFSRIEIVETRLHCGAGARMKTLAIEAKRHGVAGFEFLEGIPGSVGGALRMNAGAMNSATFDLVETVWLMDFSGEVHERTRREIEVQYRSSPTLRTHIAIGAVLVGRAEQREVIEKRMMEFSQRRWDSQPAAPSAGCIFKNPTSIPAGKLIDELGLKGARVGGAFVSSEHGNFILNDGTATARQVLELIDLIKRRAHAERGIELETEVEIVGE
jgi:UDP-N-acetylenolpyruvoylglucosamine reductase